MGGSNIHLCLQAGFLEEGQRVYYQQGLLTTESGREAGEGQGASEITTLYWGNSTEWRGSNHIQEKNRITVRSYPMN